MVVSKLEPSINYIETRELNKQDKNMEVTPFIFYYEEIPLLCALGKEKYTYVSKNIIYLPLYLIHNNKVAMQIGIFEVLASELPNILDEDTEIDINRLNDPLFFSFINKSMIEKYKYEDDDTGEDSEDDDEDDDTSEDSQDDGEDEDDDTDTDDDDDDEDEEDDTDTSEDDDDEDDGDDENLQDQDGVDRTDAIIKELFEEDESDYNEVETYTKHKEQTINFTKGDNWVQQYFKNPHFTIIDNEGGGDCLFAVIRDAFKSIGKDISVIDLRSILAKEANEDVFRGYKQLYDMFNKELVDLKKALTTMKKEHDKLKKEMKVEKNVGKKKIIVNESKKISKRHSEIKEQYIITNDLLDEFRFMEGIDTLDKFKEIIKTCKFWGETWAISTLERALNIKLIILSTDAYEQGDKENVIMCGQLNDNILRSKGVFKPKYYIMTEWLGYHYKNIAYKKDKVLTYDNIPYGVRERIVEKCLEKGEGPFGLIPKFNTLKENIETRVREKIGTSADTSISVNSKTNKELYNPDIKFQFYERSADRNPGKGSGEKIPKDSEKKFIELRKNKDWRRKLANGYESEFEINDRKWNSVEHYYQAHKFLHDKETFDKFALNSESKLSKDSNLAKIAGSDKPMKDGELLRDPKVKPNKIDDETSKKIIKKALKAKFTQNEEFKNILLSTHDAGLFLYIRGVPPKEYTLLMELRNELK